MGLITPLEDRSADIKDENIRDTTDQLQQHVASYSGIAKASLGIAKRSTRALDRIRVLEIDLRGNIPNISDEEIRDSFAVITNSMSVMCGQIQNLKQNVGDYRSNYIKVREVHPPRHGSLKSVRFEINSTRKASTLLNSARMKSTGNAEQKKMPARRRLLAMEWQNVYVSVQMFCGEKVPYFQPNQCGLRLGW
ncbi:hypothetical protein FS842_006101 [Serendipita sp. 407]|nr:hypothetical protein FS842_006101 [Serendipita sp. 407]